MPFPMNEGVCFLSLNNDLIAKKINFSRSGSAAGVFHLMTAHPKDRLRSFLQTILDREIKSNAHVVTPEG